MKTIIIRCAICLDWHLAGKHCGHCGAYHVKYEGKVKHYNARGIEMVRGIPIPYHHIVRADWSE
jgi:hypothetical protein